MKTQSIPILYHYVHCPFCVRVRMVLGFLEINYKSQVLPYHDEATPLRLKGKKMLPIMEFSDGAILNESLDIIQRLDSNDRLNFQHYFTHSEEIEDWLNEIGQSVHSMAMPYWIWTPEFNSESRAYFQSKKEAKRGPFNKLVHKRDEFESKIKETLTKLEPKLIPFYSSQELTIADIMIASHLWGMFVVPEFQFSDKIYNYLMRIKKLSHFNYHEDFWRID